MFTHKVDVNRTPLALALPPKMKYILCFLGKSSFRSGGMNVIVKGRQASRDEAPILVAAPHSTFLDGELSIVPVFLPQFVDGKVGRTTI
ncbi:hypothetical protein NQ317_018335 [Molorchus minor]|uniref:Phospholipid/glycerol acyltransferase domain-containing protein n=1 Tax=Molorchus minor TaxID=1323400 RepID=A0ABQ9J3M1_9CUCU|nr:hypothetical protein NQ317_018335 [Molorchus minor]